MHSIIVTDTHLGYKNASDLYLNTNLKLANHIAKVGKERGIKTLIHGGDFFDNRKAISTKIIPYAYKIIDILRETFDDIYILVGNHDTYYKGQINPTSLNLLQNIKEVHIVNEPIIIDSVHLQPWLIDEFKPLDCKYLIGHFEMNGIVINRSNVISKNGIPISLFKDYDLVLSGHYHTKSLTKNIQYLGSPFHMTFNDSNERGFYIFNNGILEFIEFIDYPKFLIFEYDQIDYDKISGNNIKIIFTKDIGTVKINNINKKINDLKPNQLFIKFSFDDAFNEIKNNDFEDIVDLRMIEKEYLKKIEYPNSIDKNIIKKELDNLWKEIK